MSPNFELDPADIVIYKLGRLEALMEEVKANQIAHAAMDSDFHKTQDDRIKSLENSRAKAVGMVASISVFVTAAVNYLVRAVHG